MFYIFWAVYGVFAFLFVLGAMNADEYHRWPTIYDYRDCMGGYMLWACFVTIFPPAFFAVFCLTGFMRGGWSLKNLKTNK